MLALFVWTFQICIAFLLHERMAVIPKTSKCKRIEENFNATKIILDADNMDRLRALDRNHRICVPELKLSKETMEAFWDTQADAKFKITA